MAVLAALLMTAFVRDRLEERERRDEVAVQAALGVDTVSSQGSGGGRVDHYAAVRNDAPYPVTVREVRIESGRLRVRGRPVGSGIAGPGEQVYLPLSVRLDCAEPADPSRRPELPGTVQLVTDAGREVREPVVFTGAATVNAVSRTLCRLYPELVVELSGPVH